MALNKLPEAGRISKNGFLATSRDQERPLDLTIRVLGKTVDITTIMAGWPKDEIETRMARLVAEYGKATGLEAYPFAIPFQGRQFLYLYHKFEDVRLVMTPEFEVAEFGMPESDFTFPRLGLDFVLLRVYENGRPFHPAHWFRLRKHGPIDEEPLMCAGNPIRTWRHLSLDEIQNVIQKDYPKLIDSLKHILRSSELSPDDRSSLESSIALKTREMEYLAKEVARSGWPAVPPAPSGERCPDAYGATLRLTSGRIAHQGRRGTPWTRFEELQRLAKGNKLGSGIVASALTRGAPVTKVALNFTATFDVTQGFSGGPVLDRKGSMVGVLFDLNEAGIIHKYRYVPDRTRGICLSGTAISEIIRRIPGARKIRAELER
jgi:hypothetical protein